MTANRNSPREQTTEIAILSSHSSIYSTVLRAAPFLLILFIYIYTHTHSKLYSLPRDEKNSRTRFYLRILVTRAHTIVFIIEINANKKGQIVERTREKIKTLWTKFAENTLFFTFFAYANKCGNTWNVNNDRMKWTKKKKKLHWLGFHHATKMYNRIKIFDI